MRELGGDAKRVQGLTLKQAKLVTLYLRGKGKKRDVALWSFGISVGLRVSDLLSLRVQDVLDGEGEIASRINVRESKTGQTRLIAVSSLARDALRAYLDERQPNPQEPLFIGRNGGVIGRERVRRMVKQWCEACNLRGDFGSHTLRKTFCRLAYLSSGHDPVSTCRATGHKNPAQLLAYIGEFARTTQDIFSGIDKELTI